MTTRRKAKAALAATLVTLLIAGITTAVLTASAGAKTRIVAYFDNSNGVYVGDDVVILGVPVGKIDKIEPQPMRAKITFSVEANYQVPADAKRCV